MRATCPSCNADFETKAKSRTRCKHCKKWVTVVRNFREDLPLPDAVPDTGEEEHVENIVTFPPQPEWDLPPPPSDIVSTSKSTPITPTPLSMTMGTQDLGDFTSALSEAILSPLMTGQPANSGCIGTLMKTAGEAQGKQFCVAATQELKPLDPMVVTIMAIVGIVASQVLPHVLPDGLGAFVQGKIKKSKEAKQHARDDTPDPANPN